MASCRVTKNWRSMVTRWGRSRSFVSSTAPKLAPNTATSHQPHNKYALTGEYAPVYVVMGMVVVAISIGVHTAKQQLRHSPGVYLVKKKRESLPEADTPDLVAASGGRFINKSFLRKVGHIQDPHPSSSPSSPFTGSQETYSLNNVGIGPKSEE